MAGGAIQGRRSAFTTAFQSGDYNTAGDFFTADCKYMTWGTKLINGRDAAKAYFQKTYSAPHGSVTVTADEVIEAGELAIERGSWTLTGASNDQGNHVTVWKNIGGQWYIHFMCENSSQ